MDLLFLPQRIISGINCLNLPDLSEIRLRTGYPVLVKENGVYKKLYYKNCLVKCFKEDIDCIIENLTEKSLYAYDEEIKNGFLTYKNGVRIGICGKCVFENGKVKTISQITSLVIRIPHFIKGSADLLFNKYVLDKCVKNTLIVSPPSFGKTTVLKDISISLSSIGKQVLIIDERGEFCEVEGENIDKISFSDKYYAFNYGIRSLSPEIVVADELMSESDWLFAKKASLSGVKIIASVHASDLEDVKNNLFYLDGVFETCVILSLKNGTNRIEKIVDL